jgi:actin-related protein
LKNRAEVIAMVLYEFDIEKYKQQQEDKITLLQDTVQKQQLTLQQKDEVLQQKDEEITTLKKRLAQYEPQKV